MQTGFVRSAVLAVVSAAIVSLTGCVSLRLGDTEADLVVEDVIARSRHSRLKAQTPEPTRETVRYEVHGRAYQADLYRSPQGSLAGIVLVPGLAPDGKDDPRLTALAETLARTRFAVLVPDLTSLRAYKVRSGNVREVADAFAYLASRPDLQIGERAGIAGFSYAAGPAILAALEPDIRDRVRFVLSVGGYHDLRRVATFLATGYFQARADETREWQYLRPQRYAKAVFALNAAEMLDDPADQKAIASLAGALLAETQGGMATPSPRLGPGGRALYELLTNSDPSRVPALVEKLPDRIRAELAGLNPALRDLSPLKANFILLHGRRDDMIPYTESVALSEALPPGRARLFLIDGLAHVDIRPAAEDLPELLRAIEALLAERRQ